MANSAPVLVPITKTIDIRFSVDRSYNSIDMTPIMIELSESLLLASGQSREEFAREAPFLLLLKLFELRRISSGKAAELCGIPRAEFLTRASAMGVPVADLDPEEIAGEFGNA